MSPPGQEDYACFVEADYYTRDDWVLLVRFTEVYYGSTSYNIYSSLLKD